MQTGYANSASVCVLPYYSVSMMAVAPRQDQRELVPVFTVASVPHVYYDSTSDFAVGLFVFPFGTTTHLVPAVKIARTHVNRGLHVILGENAELAPAVAEYARKMVPVYMAGLKIVLPPGNGISILLTTDDDVRTLNNSRDCTDAPDVLASLVRPESIRKRSTRSAVSKWIGKREFNEEKIMDALRAFLFPPARAPVEPAAAAAPDEDSDAIVQSIAWDAYAPPALAEEGGATPSREMSPEADPASEDEGCASPSSYASDAEEESVDTEEEPADTEGGYADGWYAGEEPDSLLGDDALAPASADGFFPDIPVDVYRVPAGDDDLFIDCIEQLVKQCDAGATTVCVAYGGKRARDEDAWDGQKRVHADFAWDSLLDDLARAAM